MVGYLCKRLGDDICQLVGGIDMLERNQTLHKLFPHKMTIELNVFSMFMKTAFLAM